MPPNQMSDQELQFKKRARRRLVGAVALVLLMITVLPMILDDRAGQAPQQDIEITIPSQEGSDFTSKIIPADPGTSETQVAEVPLEPVQQPVPDKTDPAQSTSTTTKSPSAGPNNAESAAAVEVAKPADVPVEAAVKDGFVVQIGVFSDAGNVKKLQDQLQKQGYKSFTEKVATAKGDKIRLRAGPFDSRLEAETALAKIKDAGLSGMVVKNS
jgi:DedD protein